VQIFKQADALLRAHEKDRDKLTFMSF
jgi:hypothetical protein